MHSRALQGIQAETPYLEWPAGREFQILVLDRLAWLQHVTLGANEPRERAGSVVRKSIWKKLRKKSYRLFENLLRRDRPLDRPDGPEPEQYEAWLHDYLQQDWNQVYGEIGRTGTILGYLSGYLSGNLKLPRERMQNMGLEDYDRALIHKTGHGLDSPELLSAIDGSGDGESAGPHGPAGSGESNPERAAAVAYAQRSGAQWIAVYDENGQRAGRPYEVISRLFRKQVAESFERGETLEQLRSRLVFPDLLELLERGQVTEDEYLEWSSTHLNRDFHRFAVTEAAYAWNAGKVAVKVDRARRTGIAQYVRFQ